MRAPKMVWIRGPLRPGVKVLRQWPGTHRWPKQFRWYNPDGEHFEMEVPLDAWIQLRMRDGDVEIFEPAKKPVVTADAKRRGPAKDEE